MDYKSCLDVLFSLREKKAKKSLQTMQQLSQSLGSPEKSLKSIHVAGTNGKGSVVTKIAASLAKEGYRVGRYTSPHISSFRERICINGEMISEEDVVSGLKKLFSIGIQATFFEYTTMLCFDYFARKEVDVAVLETGLGGRLDATNICEPILTVITSISLDHTQILGATIEEIAREKAGIIKPGVPLVIGSHVPRDIVQLDVPLYAVDECPQDYEEENQLIARKSLEILSKSFPLKRESIEEGVKAVPPCRFQLLDEDYLALRFGLPVPKGVILDVAHNVDGLQRLFFRLQKSFGNCSICVLCGFSQDKDVSACLQELLAKAETVIFVEAPAERAMPAQHLLEMAKKLKKTESFFAFEDLNEGVRKAFAHARDQEQLLVICGTFFIMDECRRFLMSQKIFLT
jgi:dihydrofolate synthase/folylpolyglutamate synthase